MKKFKKHIKITIVILFLFIFLFVISLLLFFYHNEKLSKQASLRMQNFVINISNYARKYNPSFIIIPQNGIELAFNNVKPSQGLNEAYINSISGIGVEELFYNGSYVLDDERLSILRQLKLSKKIMVSEFVSDNNFISEAFSKNYNEGFIAFVRNTDNYQYKKIPNIVPYENKNNISNLSLAQNYLYLINTENFSIKQEIINAISSTNFDLIIIDLFFNGIPLTQAEVNQSKTKAAPCYILYQYWCSGKIRYHWKPHWELGNPKWIKNKYQGYDDEFWVEFWDKEWQDIIYGNDNSYIKKLLTQALMEPIWIM